jgi:hypothetical protein
MINMEAIYMKRKIGIGNSRSILIRQNLRFAKRRSVGELGIIAIDRLRELTITFGFSLALGDIQYLDGGWYVTHAGLLRLALRRRCAGIEVEQEREACDPSRNSWVFKATAYKSATSKGFVGYGDANPSNVSALVRGAEMRVAETRAVNRALRKAYGIGLCSVEEFGFSSSGVEPPNGKQSHVGSGNGNGSATGEPKLRDRLCLLIRKYELDSTQVKRYAADFCGTEVLRDASRDLVESFISTLAEQAAKDRSGLICKLNSYGQVQEVSS